MSDRAVRAGAPRTNRRRGLSVRVHEAGEGKRAPAALASGVGGRAGW